jgi:hypothetical protein
MSVIERLQKAGYNIRQMGIDSGWCIYEDSLPINLRHVIYALNEVPLEDIPIHLATKDHHPLIQRILRDRLEGILP